MSAGFEQPNDSPADLTELRELAGKFPGWECWRGTMSGFWYARRHGAEPADQPVRGEDATDLADSIVRAERPRNQ